MGGCDTSWNSFRLWTECNQSIVLEIVLFFIRLDSLSKNRDHHLMTPSFSVGSVSRKTRTTTAILALLPRCTSHSNNRTTSLVRNLTAEVSRTSGRFILLNPDLSRFFLNVFLCFWGISSKGFLKRLLYINMISDLHEEHWNVYDLRLTPGGLQCVIYCLFWSHWKRSCGITVIQIRKASEMMCFKILS